MAHTTPSEAGRIVVAFVVEDTMINVTDSSDSKEDLKESKDQQSHGKDQQSHSKGKHHKSHQHHRNKSTTTPAVPVSTEEEDKSTTPEAPRVFQLVERWRCPVDMLEKHVTTTLLNLHASVKQQAITGIRKPNPFRVLGAQRRIHLSTSLGAQVTGPDVVASGGNAPSTGSSTDTKHSTKGRGAGRGPAATASAAAAAAQDEDKNRIQITTLTCDPDDKKVMIAMNSPHFPSLVVILSLRREELAVSAAQGEGMKPAGSGRNDEGFEMVILFVVCFGSSL